MFDYIEGFCRKGFPAGHLALAVTLLGAPQLSLSAIQFTDATAGSGMEYRGESYGSSWGDYNSDGLPDLFVSHHRETPSLYVNQGDGTFEDRAFVVDVWQSSPHADQHGGAWSDFDNDGDNDLFVTTGARNNGQFLVHDGSFLSDRTSDYTFDVKSWGGRLPVWFDFSRDGLLDFAIALQGQTFHLYEQSGSDFVRVNNIYGNSCTDADYGQLADLTRDGILDWICVNYTTFPNRIYDVSVRPFVDRTSLMPQLPNAIDSAFADFDGDLVSDALVVRGKERVSGAEMTSATSIEAHLINLNQTVSGVTFQASGDVTFDLHWNARSVANIFIGASGMNPPFMGKNAPLTYIFSPDDPDVAGLMPLDSNPGKESIFIGYDPTTQTWEMWNVSDSWSYLYAFVDSTESLSGLSAEGLTASDFPRLPLLYSSASGSYVDRTSAAGLNVAMPCISIAAADFDNDMDIDLYFVCRNAVSNAPNRLFENRGDGTFVQVTGVGGAAGPVGIGEGLGENVTFADYDVDGFVDMFVTNGMALFPEIPNSNGGPDKLFKNAGNGNSWIQLDLVGTVSNRDAVGARVIATTAGNKRQLREQNGGYHRWAQNQQRIHFGLGSNTLVDLEVRWPSGNMDTLTGVAADKLYRITEGAMTGGATIEEVVLPGEVDPSPCGSAGGLFPYNAGVDRGLFMGKDCVTGEWQVRVAAGGGTWVSFQGEVTAEQPYTEVIGRDLETNDILDFTTDPEVIAYKLGVGGIAIDGFDFSFPAGTNVCFGMDRPPGEPVFVGGSGMQVAVPFDLATLGECVTSTPPGDPECGDPQYNKATQPGLFAWRDCSYGGPEARWIFRASGGGLAFSEYAGAVTSNETLSAGGFNLENNDTVDSAPGDSVIDFSLLVGGSGQDGFQIDVPAGSQTCFDTSMLPAGAEVLIGAGRQVMSGAFDLLTLEACSGTPPPPADPACGAPTYNAGTEVGVFVWRNCAAPGPGQEWHARVTGGGTSWSLYEGAATSDMVLGAEGFSIESSDSFTMPDGTTAEFSFRAGGSGVDGFRLDVAEGAQTCLSTTALPAGAQIELGAGRQPMGTEFDLVTLGTCN